MNKFNLSDVAFLIPVRLDSIERLENLITSVRFLNNNFVTNIYILEADKINNGIIERVLGPVCKYTFVKDYDTIFHRTKYINQLVSLNNERILVIWDADIIINTKQIYNAARNIRNNICDVCFPYNGTFYNVTDPLRYVFMENLDINTIESNINKLSVLYNNTQNGGGIFISREYFIKGGRECEHFYGWGSEDWNRYEKWKRLGYRIFREQGPLYHLHHSRNINGQFSSIIQRRRCRTILNETIYSIPCKNNKDSYDNVIIDSDSGKWLHSSLVGHEYDMGLADGIINILKKLNIQTVVDLGCGPGWYVEDMIQHGINAFGIDGNPNIISQSSKFPCARMNCKEYDLTIPMTNQRHVDGVICIEVCEHIPSEKENILIDNIIRFDSRLLIISWASLEQKGDGHLNCKEQKDVICMFESHNYLLNREFTSFLSSCSKLWWIKNNILVFIKK